jgi:hypothetical protein
MKAKLFKKVDGEYYLLLNTPKEYPYELQPLSKKNCDELFRVADFDIDEESAKILNKSDCVEEAIKFSNANPNNDGAYLGFISGGIFMVKCILKSNKFKRFTEEDIRNAVYEGVKIGRGTPFVVAATDAYIKSLQQPTEIEVEIVMDAIPADRAPGGWDNFPKLDSEGCLILRRV